ncbi:MAG: UDP-N-acetylmuramoyl-L-alanyl-D-glutamate--2,6-diaminopimelate ligase [Bacteroidota bacterium]
MRSLQNILRDIPIAESLNFADVAVNHIQFDSRKVEQGDVFIAVRGTLTDGHNFIDAATAQGAAAIICEKMPKATTANAPVYIRVEDSHDALGKAASNYYERPSEKIQLVGVTGTNGKTTVVTLLFQLFRALGYHTGLLSTIENKIDDQIFPATHTTPDPVKINELLSQMVTQKVSYCFMEVSSHAIHQKRISGLHFDGAIFTNITQDHLDYHQTFKNYLYAKKALFDALPSDSWALVNADDKNGKVMVQNTKASKYSFGLQTAADFKAKIIENRVEGLHLNIDQHDIWFKLAGKFNASNLLAVYGAAILMQQDKHSTLSNLSVLDAAEGRFDVIKGKNIRVVLDYAHTPDALKNVLETLRKSRTDQQQLITVTGAGGNRDKGKRPLMARIASEYSDKVILTADNPRDEDPQEIINEMLQGLDEAAQEKVLSIASRREAIKTACMLANTGDVVLVAGKGHEKYQEIQGVRHPFDDKAQIKEFIK